MRKRSVSLILPNFNNEGILDLFFEKLMENTFYSDYELVVVDDGSVDESLKILKKWEKSKRFRNMKIIENEHLGIVHTLNTCLRQAQGDLVVRLDGDATIETKGWLNKMVDFYNTDAMVGMLVAKIVFENGFIHSAGRNIICPEGMYDRSSVPTESIGKRSFDSHTQRFKDIGEFEEICEVDSALGCCTMFSREDAEKIGGFDINYTPVWIEDDDFGLSIRGIGKKVFYFPEVLVIHKTSKRNPRSILNRKELAIFQLRSRIKTLIPRKVKNLIKRVIRKQAKGESDLWRISTLKHHYQFWKNKWGFDPLNPDLDFIKQVYWDTEICWRFKSESIKKGEEIVKKYLQNKREKID